MLAFDASKGSILLADHSFAGIRKRSDGALRHMSTTTHFETARARARERAMLRNCCPI